MDGTTLRRPNRRSTEPEQSNKGQETLCSQLHILVPRCPAKAKGLIQYHRSREQRKPRLPILGSTPRLRSEVFHFFEERANAIPTRSRVGRMIVEAGLQSWLSDLAEQRHESAIYIEFLNYFRGR